MELPQDDFNVEDLVCNDAFQRYCIGAVSSDQLLWGEWLRKFSHKGEVIEEARKLVTLLTAHQGNQLDQLEQLRAALQQTEILKAALWNNEKDKGIEETVSKKSSFYHYLGFAAAILVALVLIYLFRHPFSRPEDTNPAENRFSSGKVLRKTIVLKDGTVITLARESSLTLLKDFNQYKREVWLSGEAFFDVKHDAEHPFIVHTALNDVKVLGTTFNVKAYPSSRSVETVLIRGSVRVDSRQFPGCFVVLKPNEKLYTPYFPQQTPAEVVRKSYRVSELKTNGTSKGPEEVQWVKRRIDIDNLPLSVIAEKLQDWYGIKIVIADPDVKNYRYSGVFENETIIKTLEALQLSYPFQFKAGPDQITITR